jgi:hypothetical protein
MISLFSVARMKVAALCVAVLAAASCGDSPSAPSPAPGLSVRIEGLPEGAAAQVTVTGPAGFSRNLTATTTLSDLQPGSYTVAAAEVSAAGDLFRAEPASQTVEVVATRSPATVVTVGYAQTSGALEFALTGLPAGATADIHVSGPGGSFTVAQSGALRGLMPGTYIVTAGDVRVDGRSFGSSPQTQYATVTPRARTAVGIAYMLRELNLFIAGIHLSQSVQRDDMSVPFVAGRDGYVRVFAQANIDNSDDPIVRLRFLRNGVAFDSVDIGGVYSVPVEVQQNLWTRSWNARLPGHLFQPGTSIIAEIDPEDRIGERDETDNMYPVSGVPMPLNVVEAPPFRIRLVPVIQADGSMGGVTEANKHLFLADMLKMFPISGYQADVRTPYLSGSGVVAAQGANWRETLSELNALRVADGDPGYYYGVLRVGYPGGTAGIGLLPGRAALGWDRMPSAPGVLAHELGHNWGRFHAPCGNVSGVDTAYPHANGAIGVFGIDVPDSRLRAPDATDIMGYCSDQWISDYTYMAVLNYRAAEQGMAGSASVPRSTLLLWGRMNDDDLVLEPVFTVHTRPQLPATGGRFTLTGLDDAGRLLFQLSFDPEQVNEHAPQPESQFAFAVPLDDAARRQLATVRLSGDGREVVRRVGAARPDPTAAAVRIEDVGGQSRVSWDAAEYPMVMLRDARTGDIVSFARGGRSTVPVPAAALQAVASDGVRSTVFGATTLPER